MSKILKTVLVIGAAIALVAFAPEIAGAIGFLAQGFALTAATLASITSAVVGIGLSLGLSAVSALFQKTPSLSNSLASRLSLNEDTTAPRKIIFGNTAAGCDLRFKEVYGKDSDRMALVIALASHKLNAIQSVYLDTVLSWQGHGIPPVGTYKDGIDQIWCVEEGSHANAHPVGTGQYWTGTSYFTGCAYSQITYKLDKTKVWTQGLPSKITTIVEGCPVYDPRLDSTNGGSGPHRPSDQTTWTYYNGGNAIGRNPALALITFLIGWKISGKLVWGMGIPANRINFASFITYANICEESVQTTSGSVQRYTCDGIFSTSDSFETVINTICLSMGTSILVDVDGVYTLIEGYDDTLTTPFALTGDDIVSPGVWSPSPAARERFTSISGRFADPSQLYVLNDWGSIDVDPLYDGIPRSQTVDMGCVNRAETAQRIAKQMLVKSKYGGTYSAVFGPRAFGVSVGSLVSLSLGPQGFNNKLFRVVQQEESYDLLFQMVLREESPEIYEWDKSEEVPLPTTILESTFDPISAETVEGLAMSARTVNGVNSVDTIYIDVTWTPPQSLRTESIEIQSQPVGASLWTTEVERFAEVATGAYTFAAGVNGAGVNIQARYRMSNGAYGAWVETTIGSTPTSTVNQWSAVFGDSKPADGATVGAVLGGNLVDGSGVVYKIDDLLTSAGTANDTSNVGGVPASDVISKLNAAAAAVDTVAPAIPTGLGISSTVVGTTGLCDVVFIWNANTESDLAGYDLQIATNGGNFVAFPTSNNSYIVHNIQPNTQIKAEVRARDKSGNVSGYSAVVSANTVKDTTAPNAPTAFNVQSVGLGGLNLSWTNDSAADLVTVAVYEGTDTNSADAIQITTVNAIPGEAGGYSRSGLPSGSVRNYWLKSIDTSGNASVFSAMVTGTVASVSNADFTPGLAATASVASLPSATGYTGPKIVFNEQDGKIYRYTGGAFVATVPTVDLSGVVTAAQIASASIDASKIAAGLNVPLLVAKANMNDGSVVAPYGGALAYNETDGKLYANRDASHLATAWYATVTDATQIAGQITAAQIAAGTIDATKLSSGLTAPQVVSKSNINDGTIVAPFGGALAYNIADGKLYRNTDGAHLSTAWLPIFVGAADLTGQITSTQITDGSISTPKLAAGAVTATNIAAQTITAAQIAADTITAGQIAAGAITASELAAGSVTATNVVAGSLTGDRLAAQTITATQIATDTITASQIAAGAITTSELAAGSVTATNIVGGTITGDKVAVNTIAGGNIAANTITGGNIAADTITAGNIAAGAITASELAAGAVTATAIGVTGASLFPDGQVQNQAWWTSSPVAGVPGYQQPANSWYIDTNPDAGVVANKGGLNGWVTAGIQGSTADIYLIAPAVGGVISGEYYEFKATMWNATSRNFVMWVEWRNASGTLLSGSGISQPPSTVSQKSVQIQAPTGASSYRLYWVLQAGTAIASGQLGAVGGITVRQANSGTMVIDGSLSATKITAGTITSTQIAANSITGDRISSSSSLPASLTIGNTGFNLGTIQSAAAAGSNGSNILPYSDFQAGPTGGWHVSYNPSGAWTGYYGPGNDQGRNYVAWQFYARNTYAADSNQQVSISTDQFQVMPGTYIYTGAYFQGDSCDIALLLFFYAGDGTTLVGSLTAPTWTLGVDPTWPGSGSSWEGCRKGVFGYVPTNAAFGRMEIYEHSRVADNQVHTAYFANPMVIPCTPGQTVPPAYVPGPAPNVGAVINANTTLIGAGKIQTSGSNTIANWIYGGDNTSINGGSIATNTIAANKVTIGTRGINTINIVFSYDKGYIVTWTDGYVEWMDESFNRQVTHINAGSASRVSQGGGVSGVAFVYFDRSYSVANGVLLGGESSAASIMANPNNVILACYFGGTSLQVNYGQTVIDGSNIYTGSINASQTITAQSIVASNIQDNSLTQKVILSNGATYAGTGMPSTGGGTAGGGAGGGGNNSCVHVASFLPSGKIAGDVAAGDDLFLLNRNDDDGYHLEPVERIRFGFERCLRIETASGITLVASLSTPITTRNGVVLDIRDSLGAEVPVLDRGVFRWEAIVALEDAGEREVALISAGDGTYAAGELDDDRFIFTHNNTVKP